MIETSVEKNKFRQFSKENSKRHTQFDSWRVLQILSEFVMGFEQLSSITPAVTIFGSARFHADHPYYQIAETIAHELSEAGFAVLTGGGPGIMEAANKGAFQGQSPSVGINISLPHEPHNTVNKDMSLDFSYFFVRKVMLVRYASAYVVLPGGFGTLDELTEVLTLIQTEKMPRAPVILVNRQFWSGLLDWLRETLVAEKTISVKDLDLITIADDAKQVLDTIFAFYDTPESAMLHMDSLFKQL